MSNGKSASAVSRAIIENDLIEEHHWLPQDIAKIPYRSLQMYYLIKRNKVAARSTKVAVDKIKQDANASGKKQARRR